MEILFGKYDVINISLKDENELIHSLLVININTQLEDVFILLSGCLIVLCLFELTKKHLEAR